MCMLVITRNLGRSVNFQWLHCISQEYSVYLWVLCVCTYMYVCVCVCACSDVCVCVFVLCVCVCVFVCADAILHAIDTYTYHAYCY